MSTTVLKKAALFSISPSMLMDFYLNGKAIFVPKKLLSQEQKRLGERITKVIQLNEFESILILS